MIRSSKPFTPWVVLEIAGLMLFCAALCALNVAWIGQNSAPPRGDDNSHLLHSLTMYGLIAGDSPDRLRSILLWGESYPPLTYAVTALFYFFLGPGIESALMSFLPWLVLAVICLYAMGRRLGGPALGGLFALLPGTSPALLHYSRSYYIDFPLASLTVAAMCAFVLSDGFRRRLPSLLFGAAVGLALLTKWSVVFFLLPGVALMWLYLIARGSPNRWVLLAGLLAPPALVAGGMHLSPLLAKLGAFGARFPLFAMQYLTVALAGAAALVVASTRIDEKERPFTARLHHMACALWAAISIAGMWYLAAVPALGERALLQAEFNRGFTFAGTARFTVPFTLQLFSFTPALLLAGLIGSLVIPPVRKAYLAAAACLASGFLLTTWAVPPDLRYMLPALPFLALVTLPWLGHGKAPKALFFIIAIPCALGQAGGWVLAEKFPALADRLPLTYVTQIPPEKLTILNLSISPLAPPPGKGEPAIDEIVEALRADLASVDRAETYTVGVMNHRDRCPLQMRTFDLYGKMARLPLQFGSLEGGSADMANERFRYYLELFERGLFVPPWKEETEKRFGVRLAPLGEWPIAGGAWRARLFRVKGAAR